LFKKPRFSVSASVADPALAYRRRPTFGFNQVVEAALTKCHSIATAYCRPLYVAYIVASDASLVYGLSTFRITYYGALANSEHCRQVEQQRKHAVAVGACSVSACPAMPRDGGPRPAAASQTHGRSIAGPGVVPIVMNAASDNKQTARLR